MKPQETLQSCLPHMHTIHLYTEIENEAAEVCSEHTPASPVCSPVANLPSQEPEHLQGKQEPRFILGRGAGHTDPTVPLLEHQCCTTRTHPRASKEGSRQLLSPSSLQIYSLAPCRNTQPCTGDLPTHPIPPLSTGYPQAAPIPKHCYQVLF